MKGVLTLCGSTRFYKEFDRICYELTLADYAVFTIGTMLNSDTRLDHSKQTLERFDKLHKSKIIMSEGIFVIDVGGYIGDSTKSEIEFAQIHGRDIYYLSKGDLQKLTIADNREGMLT